MNIRGFPLSNTSSSNPLSRSRNSLDPWISGLLFVELTCRLIRTNCGDSNDPHFTTAIRTLLWSALVVKLAWRLLCQHPAMWWALDFFPPDNTWLDKFWSYILNGTELCIHYMAMLGEWLAPCRDLVNTVACNHVAVLWSTLSTWLQGDGEQEQPHNDIDDNVDDESMEGSWSKDQNWTNFPRDWSLTRSKAPQDKHV